MVCWWLSNFIVCTPNRDETAWSLLVVKIFLTNSNPMGLYMCMVGWVCAFRSLTFCKIKILNIGTFTQLVAGEKITLQMRRWVKGFCSVFRYKVQSTLWSETDTFGTGSVSLTMVSVLWINKGSKERQGPALGVRFTELSVLYTGKNNGFPFLDILGYLKNTHKNLKFGRVRQVPIRELGWEFPGWDLSHFAKFGIFMGIL